MTSTAVDLYQPGQVLALNHDTGEIAEALTMNLGGSQPSKFMLDQATVPGPGGKRWKVVESDGTENDPATLTGIIVAVEKARSYWAKPYESGGDPPDCASYDGGITGVANTPQGPGTRCAECPMDAWNSGPEGVGKACRETKHLLLLPNESVLPILVRVPPTSLRIMDGFLFKQGGKGHPFYSFVVELGIGRTKTGRRSDVPCVAPRFVGMLEQRERDLARAYADQLGSLFARTGPPDVAPANGHGDPSPEEVEEARDRAYGETLPVEE